MKITWGYEFEGGICVCVIGGVGVDIDELARSCLVLAVARISLGGGISLRVGKRLYLGGILGTKLTDYNLRTVFQTHIVVLQLSSDSIFI